MKLIKKILLALSLLCASQAYAAPELGKDYTVLNPVLPTHSGKKIEVLEFFSYGCIHCYNLNPMMKAWSKRMPNDVTLTYVPVVFRANMEVAARALYATEFLGLHNKLHDALFDIWHSDSPPYDEASLTAALAPYDVDAKKFHSAYTAYSMRPVLARALGMQKSYGIRGTPTLIIGGKYVIPGESAHAVQILNALIDKVRKEKKH